MRRTRVLAVPCGASAGVAMLLALAACGGGGESAPDRGSIASAPESPGISSPAGSSAPSSSSSTSTPPAPAVLSGTVAKGPVAGAEVCAYEMGAAGTGRRLACTQSDSDGSYTLLLDHAGPVVLEGSGGSYRDEATGEVLALATPLRTVALAQGGTTVTAMVTPLTHFAYVQALAQGLSLERFIAAAASVRDAVAPGVDVPAGPIVVREGADNAHGAALRTVSRALANGATLEGMARSFTATAAQAGLRRSQWCFAGADGHLAGWNILVDAPFTPGAAPGTITVAVQQPDAAWRAGLGAVAGACTVTANTADGVTLSCPANVAYSVIDLRAGASATQGFAAPQSAGEIRAAGQRLHVSGGPIALAPDYVLRLSAADGIADVTSFPPVGGTTWLDTPTSLMAMAPAAACALAADGTPQEQPAASGSTTQPGTIVITGTTAIASPSTPAAVMPLPIAGGSSSGSSGYTGSGASPGSVTLGGSGSGTSSRGGGGGSVVVEGNSLVISTSATTSIGTGASPMSLRSSQASP